MLEANDGGRAYQLTLRRLVCLAGRALRKAGALEDAFAAFTVSTTAWLDWSAPGSVEELLIPVCASVVQDFGCGLCPHGRRRCHE